MLRMGTECHPTVSVGKSERGRRVACVRLSRYVVDDVKLLAKQLGERSAKVAPDLRAKRGDAGAAIEHVAALSRALCIAL